MTSLTIDLYRENIELPGSYNQKEFSWVRVKVEKRILFLFFGYFCFLNHHAFWIINICLNRINLVCNSEIQSHSKATSEIRIGKCHKCESLNKYHSAFCLKTMQTFKMDNKILKIVDTTSKLFLYTTKSMNKINVNNHFTNTVTYLISLWRKSWFYIFFK